MMLMLNMRCRASWNELPVFPDRAPTLDTSYYRSFVVDHLRSGNSLPFKDLFAVHHERPLRFALLNEINHFRRLPHNRNRRLEDVRLYYVGRNLNYIGSSNFLEPLLGMVYMSRSKESSVP